MKKQLLYFVLTVCLFNAELSFSQDLMQFTLKGKISNAVDSTAVAGASLINITNIDGIATGNTGLFEIDVKESDTLLISCMGFESIKLKITKDLSKGTELNIGLFPQVEQLEEVKIYSYKIIGVLDIDVKNIPKDKFNRVHINGLQQTYEIQKNASNSNNLTIGKALVNPVDFIYNLFGTKPKKLRDLKKLRDQENTRNILANRFDRELILDYLQMNIDELTQVLTNCNYSSYFIKNHTDLQIIEAVLECYDNRKAVKNGSTSEIK